jgi:hypothetical protein
MVFVAVIWRSCGGLKVSLVGRWECGISTCPQASALPNRGVNNSGTIFRARAVLGFLMQWCCPGNLFQRQKVCDQVGQVLLAQRLAVRHYHG